MESNRQLTSNQSDEIDLVALFTRFVVAVKGNVIFIIIAVLMGIGLGFTYYKVSPKIYESQMLVISEVLTESHGKSLIDNLTKLIRERNYQALSQKLSIPPEQAAMLSGFEIEDVTPKESDAKTKAMYLSIQVKTKDNGMWKELEAGLINYLKSSEYLSIRVKQNIKYLTEVIKKIDLELADLEKLKTRRATGKGDGQPTNDGLFYFNPASINATIIELNREKLSLQNSLENVESVQVLESFNVFDKPDSPKLLPSIGSGLFLSFILIILIFVVQTIVSLIKIT